MQKFEKGLIYLKKKLKMLITKVTNDVNIFLTNIPITLNKNYYSPKVMDNYILVRVNLEINFRKVLFMM